MSLKIIFYMTIFSMLFSNIFYLSLNESNDSNYVEFMSVDFSNEIEVLKHIDNRSECYDSGTRGNSKGYVDIKNKYFVFIGDNEENRMQVERDEPIIVIKNYGEENNPLNYAIMPYNYSVEVKFLLPQNPGYGNFYIFPRFKTVADKYEVVVDSLYDTLVFNKVVNNTWSNIKIVPLNFHISTDRWYNFYVEVRWEYNYEKNEYMNHIIATITDPQNMSNSVKDEIWDDDLLPVNCNGLAFLGFHAFEKFKVYMDDIVIKANMEKIYEEPDEYIVPNDLDIKSLYVYNDTKNVFILLELYSQINICSIGDKYWILQFDVDKDSRNLKLSFDSEYTCETILSCNGTMFSYLYSLYGEKIYSIHILGGGISYNYFVIRIPKKKLFKVNSIYIYASTFLDKTELDIFPGSPSENVSGGYLIYYLKKNILTWKISKNDPRDNIEQSYLDILNIKGEYRKENIYFSISVAGNIPWFGGVSAGIYHLYLDVDDDNTTGYRIEDIGADYMIEYIIGHIPVLWRYSGNGSNWRWEFAYKEEYMFNPGGGRNIVIIIPVKHIRNRGQQITVLGQTVYSKKLLDSTHEVRLSIPHPSTNIFYSNIIYIIIIVLLIFGIYYIYRKIFSWGFLIILICLLINNE